MRRPACSGVIRVTEEGMRANAHMTAPFRARIRPLGLPARRRADRDRDRSAAGRPSRRQGQPSRAKARCTAGRAAMRRAWSGPVRELARHVVAQNLAAAPVPEHQQVGIGDAVMLAPPPSRRGTARPRSSSTNRRRSRGPWPSRPRSPPRRWRSARPVGYGRRPGGWSRTATRATRRTARLLPRVLRPQARLRVRAGDVAQDRRVLGQDPLALGERRHPALLVDGRGSGRRAARLWRNRSSPPRRLRRSLRGRCGARASRHPASSRAW